MIDKFLDHKLCYVDDEEYVGEPMTLYFTEKDVTEQWGDDWDDAPYEHNSEIPYYEDYSQEELYVENGRGHYPPISIFRVMICSQYISTPRTGKLNSPYCVRDINQGVVPWLTYKRYDEPAIYIKAGTTLKEFLDIMEQHKDYVEVYLEKRWE